MPTYAELLNSPLWKLKRVEILSRDKYKCKSCSNIKLLQDATIGYIKRYEDNHSLIIGGANNNTPYVNFIDLIKLSDNHFYQTIPINIDWPIEKYNNKKNYLVYFDFKTEASENLEALFIALAEIEDECENIGKTYFPKKINPFRDENFLNEAHFLVVSTLHIHHTYYQVGLMPWEYPNHSLETLCRICHEEFHTNNKVPLKNSSGQVIAAITPCDRCDGWGYLPHYRYVQNGICFKCNEKKFQEVIKF